MAAHGVVAIIKVECMRGCAIDQRRIQSAGALLGAQQKAGAVAKAEREAAQACSRFAAAGQRHPEGVKNAHFGPVHSRLRQVAPLQLCAAGGQSTGKAGLGAGRVRQCLKGVFQEETV